MARIELSPAVLDDFDRILGHLDAHGVADLSADIAGIVAAIQILAHSSDIGRPTRGGLRELLIGRGARGYVALYRHVRQAETVFVLAIRSQREDGFKR
jgi:plasmid stabilization system protein ParE